MPGSLFISVDSAPAGVVAWVVVSGGRGQSIPHRWFSSVLEVENLCLWEQVQYSSLRVLFRLVERLQ